MKGVTNVELTIFEFVIEHLSVIGLDRDVLVRVKIGTPWKKGDPSYWAVASLVNVGTEDHPEIEWQVRCSDGTLPLDYVAEWAFLPK